MTLCGGISPGLLMLSVKNGPLKHIFQVEVVGEHASSWTLGDDSW